MYLFWVLLWVEDRVKAYSMYVSSPSGRSRTYSYYITHAKPDGKKIHVSCEVVDRQIPGWLGGITIPTDLLPAIRKIYQSQIKETTDENNRERKRAELKRQLSQLGEEEARLGRLLITDKISEGTYEQLRKEWQEKKRNLEAKIVDLNRETTLHLDDLEIALMLLTKINVLFHRLSENDRAALLRVLVKRIIVDSQGEIIGSELNSPFAYLRYLADEFQPVDIDLCGSDQVRLGAPII